MSDQHEKGSSRDGNNKRTGGQNKGNSNPNTTSRTDRASTEYVGGSNKKNSGKLQKGDNDRKNNGKFM